MSKEIEIVVEGGMVVEVNGLPVDWEFHVTDKDCEREGLHEGYGYTGNALPKLLKQIEEDFDELEAHKDPDDPFKLDIGGEG